MSTAKESRRAIILATIILLVSIGFLVASLLQERFWFSLLFVLTIAACVKGIRVNLRRP